MTYIKLDENGNISMSADWSFPGSQRVEYEVVRGYDGKLYKAGEEPQKDINDVKKEFISIIDANTSKSIEAGFTYEIVTDTGTAESLHFSYDSFDQQNFADSANAALLVVGGIGGEAIPNSIVWNAYRNHTDTYKGDLVRLVLTPTTFLQLYTAGALVHKATQMEIGGQRKAAIENAKTVEEINTMLEEWGIVQNTTNTVV